MTTHRSHNLLRLTGLLLLSTAGALYGCDGGTEDAVVPCTPPLDAPAGPVVVQTDCAAYAPADSIVTSLRNTSDRAYLYGPCGVSLERWRDAAWAAVEGCSFGPEATVDGEAGCICEAYGVDLGPGGESTLALSLFSGLAPGHYRVRVEMSHLEAPPTGEREPVLSFSNEFEVRR